MSKLDEIRARAGGFGDIHVHQLTIIEEMFFAHDITVRAKISVFTHALVGRDELGEFHTALTRRLTPSHHPVSYRKGPWFELREKDVLGEVLPPRSELTAILDQELRAFLLNRFGAELQDSIVELPYATAGHSMWQRFIAWIKET